MWQGLINIGPGPNHPVTDFGQAYSLQVPAGYAAAISADWDTTWVSYIYVLEGAEGGVIGEITNADGNNAAWIEASVEAPRLITFLNYHKVNVSPGGENPNDPFFQGRFSFEQSQRNPDGTLNTWRVGFTDGGRPDNAVANLQFIKLEPVFHPV